MVAFDGVEKNTGRSPGRARCTSPSTGSRSPSWIQPLAS